MAPVLSHDLTEVPVLDVDVCVDGMRARGGHAHCDLLHSGVQMRGAPCECAHPEADTEGKGPAARLAEDAGELWTLQRAAYATEAQLHDDPHLPMLVQTLDQLRLDLAERTALKAVAGSRIVGSIQAHAREGILHIARMAVAPDWQGRGIGSRLLAAIEASAPPDTGAAALFTGSRSAANLAMYARRGYRILPQERLGEQGTSLVHRAKELTPPAPAPGTPSASPTA